MALDKEKILKFKGETGALPLKEILETIIDEINGENWQTVTLNEGFEHGALASSGNLMVKKVVNIVFIKGSVKGFTGEQTICANLSEEYRPSTRIDIMLGTGGSYFAKGMVTAGGNIQLLSDTRGTISEGNWYSICASWIAE